MAVDVTEVLKSRIDREVMRSVSDVGDFEFKQQLYSAVINMLGSFNKKTAALEKLAMMLIHEKPEVLRSVSTKLFPALLRILNQNSESSLNRKLSGKCLIYILKVSVDGGEFQREVASAVPSMLGALINTDLNESLTQLMSVIMRLYPGPCGSLRGQIWSRLTGLIGKGLIRREELGSLFALYPQLGGGGREGVEHTRAFTQCWQVVSNTVNSLLNQMFKYIKGSETSLLSRELIDLEEVTGTGSFSDQVLRIAQFTDLIEVECSLITAGFPQVREIDCEGTLSQIGRILSISPEALEQSDIPENKILAVLLPSLHVQALQLLQALIIGLEDEVVPEAATINNILIKTFQITSSEKVREALYSTLSVYLKIVGASTGIEHCVDRIIPYLGQDITPQQDKILLSTLAKRQAGGGKKKKKSKTSIEDMRMAKREIFVVPLCSSAIKFACSLVEQIGPLLSDECFRDISCLLINLAIKNDLREPSILVSLYEALGQLGCVMNPAFNSPVRLIVHVLQAASNNSNQEVGQVARRALSSLNLALHPQCPSLHIPVIDEAAMRKVVASIIDVGADDSDGAENQTELKNGHLEFGRSVSNGQITSKERTLFHEKIPVSGKISEKVNEEPKPGEMKNRENLGNAFSEKRFRESSSNIDRTEKEKSVSKKQSSTVNNATVDSAATKRNEKGLQTVKPDSSNLKRKIEESPKNEILENVDELQSNIQEMEDKKRLRNESQGDADKTDDLDVSEMLKDFSDKLKENLLPDPWDSD